MRRLLFAAIALLLAAPAVAQIRYEANKNCIPQGGAMQDAPGRGCLLIEASGAAFTELRDALTAQYADVGGGNVTFVCDACAVAKGVSGCSSSGDQVTKTRRSAALIRIACILTSLRDQKALADDVQAAEDAFVPGADIGNGEPG